MQPID